ncbi:MAG: hypothetical protein WA323_13960 [Candidatus Nitrosopolaris sp.]
MKFISTDYYPRKRFVNTASNEEKKQFKKKAKDFRQYDVFNQYAFLKYLKDLQRKFRKLLLFIYIANQHRSSIMIRQNLEENKEVIRVEYLPKGSPDYNAGDKEKKIFWYQSTILNPPI